MGIANRFSRLIERIQPLQSELDAAEQRLGTIKTKLNSVFDLCDCRVNGSFARETSIRGSSDLDVFPVFRKAEFTWAGSLVSSDTALNRIRESLILRYPSTTVERDAMAVTISFSDKQRVDIVPALFESFHESKRPIYHIPDGVGGWMKTCPAVYDKFIAEANRRSGGKLRFVAQLIKFWRECRTQKIPISSFHIEMLLAEEAICKVAQSYEECFYDVMAILSKRQCRAMQDPFGIAGYISAVKTPSQREFALRSVNHSLQHAGSAILTNNLLEAKRQWNLVFNDHFPS